VANESIWSGAGTRPLPVLTGSGECWGRITVDQEVETMIPSFERPPIVEVVAAVDSQGLSGSIGSGRRASVWRTHLGRRDDELANAAEAAAVAGAIG